MGSQNLDAILKMLDDEDALTIYVQGPEDIYLEKAEHFERVDMTLNDAGEVKALLQALGQQAGRSLSTEEKVVNFRLAGGMRVSAFNSPGAQMPLICISRWPSPRS